MDKPDDISADVWEYAEKAVFSPYPSASERIARAMMYARMEGLEAAALHLDQLAKDSPLGHENAQRGRSTYNWLTYASQAIRQHSQKGEGNADDN